MKPKVSVVTGHYNQKKLYINVLRSLLKSKYKNDIEVVVTDDGSDPDQRLDDVPAMFPELPIKLTTINKEDKKWGNSSIAFNISIYKAEGEITILNSAECYHATDYIAYVIEHLQRSDYYTCKTFALTEEMSKDIENTIKTFPFESVRMIGNVGGWYNHPVYHQANSHWGSAIYTDIMQEKIGGFDERLAYGWGYDDWEMVTRIKRLGLRVSSPNDQLVLHQYHIPTKPTAEWPSNESKYNAIIREGNIKAPNKR